MNASRLKMTVKNIFYSYMSNFIMLILNFVSRTIFIKTLGNTYLGVNGLFTNVLGVLSFAELGIGTVLNFNLYKPVAENDKEKIKSVMNLYKISYRIIAFIITVIGLCILPFLNFIVKDPGNVGDIRIYYLIFLFNTVSGYFVSYKFSLVNAEQKNYIMTNINTAVMFFEKVFQIFVLIKYKSFIVYLLTATVIGLLQKIFVSWYLNRKYPYLLDKNVAKLSKDELEPIKKNVGGLIWHKFGEVSIYQTDNIIISSFINVTTVGIVSNYNMIISTIQGFLNMIFSGTISSLGNLVATTDLKKQFDVFKKYNFIDFWLFGFCSIAFFILIPPFITLWIGEENLIGIMPLLLLCLNFYFLGQRIAFQNYKTAFGVFYDDKYVVLQAAVMNLIISVVGARFLGLTGIYIGTLCSGLWESIRRPVISYERITGDKIQNFFKVWIKYFVSVLIPGFVLFVTKDLIIDNLNIFTFLILCLIVTFFVNGWFYILYRKSEEFIYVKNMAINYMKGKKKNG